MIIIIVMTNTGIALPNICMYICMCLHINVYIYSKGHHYETQKCQHEGILKYVQLKAMRDAVS